MLCSKPILQTVWVIHLDATRNVCKSAGWGRLASPCGSWGTAEAHLVHCQRNRLVIVTCGICLSGVSCCCHAGLRRRRRRYRPHSCQLRHPHQPCAHQQPRRQSPGLRKTSAANHVLVPRQRRRPASHSRARPETGCAAPTAAVTKTSALSVSHADYCCARCRCRYQHQRQRRHQSPRWWIGGRWRRQVHCHEHATPTPRCCRRRRPRHHGRCSGS